MLALAALLGAAGAVAVVLLVNPDSPCRHIDYAAFRESDQGDVVARVRSCDALDGKDRAHVHALLGWPTHQEQHAEDWAFYASADYETGGTLVVTYDADDRVTSTRTESASLDD